MIMIMLVALLTIMMLSLLSVVWMQQHRLNTLEKTLHEFGQRQSVEGHTSRGMGQALVRVQQQSERRHQKLTTLMTDVAQAYDNNQSTSYCSRTKALSSRPKTNQQSHLEARMMRVG